MHPPCILCHFAKIVELRVVRCQSNQTETRSVSFLRLTDMMSTKEPLDAHTGIVRPPSSPARQAWVLCISRMFTAITDMMSKDERRELQEHPLGTILAPLSPDRLELRFRIARKLFDGVQTTKWFQKLPKRMRTVYAQKPPWKFYTCNGSANRVYGVMEQHDDGLCTLRAFTAYKYVTTDVVDGIECADAGEVSDWTKEQRAVILTNIHPSMFFDPCGWFPLARDCVWCESYPQLIGEMWSSADW